MQIVTVGPKYQIVIPKEVRKTINGIKPGDKVSVYIEDNKISVAPQTKSWMERTSGIAKEAWKDIDTTKYLEELRNEWDRKY